MKLLLTGANGTLATRLLPPLAQTHEIRALDDAPPSAPPGASVEQITGDLRDREFAATAVAGCDAILHLAPLAPPATATPSDQLDRAARGSYNLLQAAIAAGVKRVVLASTLRLFERYPPEWWVVESWAPRPTTDVADLGPYLAELTCREIARVSPLHAICLRLGEVVDDAEAATRPFDPRWVHVDDVVQAFSRALQVTTEPWPGHGWSVYHVTAPGPRSRFRLAAAGQKPLGYAPTHDFQDRWSDAGTPPSVPTPSADATAVRPHREHRLPRRIVVYGAGGPLAAAADDILARDRVLRLTDVRPIAEIAASDPQSPGAPLPRVLGPPHEERLVDVTNREQVVAAAEGMDAIVNCTVVRHDPVEAFRVNVLGAYHVMLAAVSHGIRRVVHTGPQQVTAGHSGPFGYNYDFRVVDDVPPRPAGHLYILSKFLGQEICRIFTEDHDLEVPTLLFTNFHNPANPPSEPMGINPMSVSWNDAGEALRCALDVPALPSPFEVMHILTDLPHGKFPNDKAKRLLGWEPRDRLEHHWHRPEMGAPNRQTDTRE